MVYEYNDATAAQGPYLRIFKSSGSHSGKFRQYVGGIQLYTIPGMYKTNGEITYTTSGVIEEINEPS